MKVNDGFTFLEVMIALSIIAIALTAVLNLQSQSLSMANEVKLHTTASLLAQSKVSEIESTPPAEMESDSGDFGEDFPDYSWRIDINDVIIENPEGISNFLKQMDLSVYRNGYEDNSYRVRLIRFVPEVE